MPLSVWCRHCVCIVFGAFNLCLWIVDTGKWTPPPTTPPSMHFGLELTQPLQMLFDSSASSPEAVFFLVDLGPGAAVDGMRIEITTGYSCYIICNNSRHKMALQLMTEQLFFILRHSCLWLCLSHVFVIVFVFSILTMTFMTFSQFFLWHPRIPVRSTASDIKMHEW